MPDFLPRQEGKLLHWSRAFMEKIMSTPEAFSLSEQQAQAYAQKHQLAAHAYRLSKQQSTRGPSKTFRKNRALASLKEEARMLAGIVRASPTVTPEQRRDLGLTVRAEPVRSVEPPNVAPELLIVSASGYTVTATVYDPENFTRLRKPAGVASIVIFRHVGEEPPQSIDDWSYARTVTRTKFTITFPPDTPRFAKVWLVAQWVNTRGEGGPLSAAICTHLPGGAVHFPQQLLRAG